MQPVTRFGRIVFNGLLTVAAMLCVAAVALCILRLFRATHFFASKRRILTSFGALPKSLVIFVIVWLLTPKAIASQTDLKSRRAAMTKKAETPQTKWLRHLRFAAESLLLCAFVGVTAYALSSFGVQAISTNNRWVAIDSVIFVILLIIYVGTDSDLTPLCLIIPNSLYLPEKTRNDHKCKDDEEWEKYIKLCDRDAAIRYCEWEIEFYGDVFGYNHRQWKRWQTIVIVGGSLATLITAASPPDSWKPWLAGAHLGWLRGLPTALVTIAAGIAASFNFQREAIRQGVTSDALQGELAKFISGAKPYDGEDDKKKVSFFMDNIRTIIMSEQGEWSKSPGKP